jgi:hypothetical protein
LAKVGSVMVPDWSLSVVGRQNIRLARQSSC